MRSLLFQHVLIPLDFSSKNATAIRMASEIAKPSGARITLLHVIETLDDSPDEEIRSFYQKLETRAEARLTRIKADLDRQGLAAGKSVTLGKRAQEIVDYALRNGVDLIVLSSHRFAPASTPAWPSISHKVALLSPVPVLLVRSVELDEQG